MAAIRCPRLGRFRGSKDAEASQHLIQQPASFFRYDNYIHFLVRFVALTLLPTMPLLATCPQCQQKYNLRDEYAGQQVRCPRCSAVFLAPAANPFQDPLAPVPSESVPLPPITPISPGGNYLPTGAWVAGGSSGQAPSETGPTDVQFRIGGAGMAGAGLFLAVMTYLMHIYQNQVFLLAVVLIPPAIIMGLTTLIHPDTTRSVGKWGKHLPWHLRAIGWTLMSVSLVLGLTLLFLILSTGDYRPG